MKNPARMAKRQSRPFWSRAAIALMASTLALGSYSTQIHAVTPPLRVSQQPSWDAVLKVARLLDSNQNPAALVLQLNVLNKPATSYANAVYQIFARRNDRWVQVYTSTGARLITNSIGQTILLPEIVPLKDLRQQLGSDVDLSKLELKAVSMLRYDVAGGQRDQTVQFEQSQFYSAISQTTTTQLVTSSSSETGVIQSGVVGRDVRFEQTSQTTQLTPISGRNNAMNVHRGHFSLAVVQNQEIYDYVVARVSLEAKRSEGYLRERFVGDFKYKVKGKGKLKDKYKAKFIRGLNPGDRVIVRLFSPQNQFIGYSEFELLEDFSTVTLVLPSQPAQIGIVRTVYGIDSNQDGAIDRGTQVFDYFTQVSQVTSQSFSDARVTFLSTAQNIVLNAFNIGGLPTPSFNCVYPTSFQSGYFSLVSRVLRVFSSDLAPAITAVPGQLVSITNISETTTSSYEVTQQILNYREVGITQGTISSGDDYDSDDGNGKKPRRHCNQGIGNGSEGCDPGNSRPHGGSNDEGGRTPGHRNK